MNYLLNSLRKAYGVFLQEDALDEATWHADPISPKQVSYIISLVKKFSGWESVGPNYGITAKINQKIDFENQLKKLTKKQGSELIELLKTGHAPSGVAHNTKAWSFHEPALPDPPKMDVAHPHPTPKKHTADDEPFDAEQALADYEMGKGPHPTQHPKWQSPLKALIGVEPVGHTTKQVVSKKKLIGQALELMGEIGTSGHEWKKASTFVKFGKESQWGLKPPRVADLQKADEDELHLFIAAMQVALKDLEYEKKPAIPAFGKQVNIFDL